MTAGEAADHQWLKSTNCNNRSQNQEKETRGQEVSSTPIQPLLSSLQSSETVGGVGAVSEGSELEANNWLSLRIKANWSTSHPFVPVCLSMEEDESLEMSGKERWVRIKANHLSLSSSPPPAITCPLLTDQKGDMVVEQEEEEEKDPTDEEQNTIVEHIILDQPNANVPNIRVDKKRGKRAREEGSRGILDAKKMRQMVCETDAKKKRQKREDTSNFGTETEQSLTPLPEAGLSKMRRAKRRKGRMVQGIKMRN